MSTTTSAPEELRIRSADTGRIYNSPTVDLLTEIPEETASPVTLGQPTRRVAPESVCEIDGDEDLIDEELIGTLETVADSIIPALENDIPNEFRDQLDTWCGVRGLDDITHVETRTIIARQAVFNLFLKVTLYEWYHQRGDLPELPSKLRTAFQRAHKRTENPGFDECVLDEVVFVVDETVLEPVVSERHRLLQSMQPAEDIGSLYEALTTNESRRALGQFRTPPEIGDLMKPWTARNRNAILDIGLGAAGLSSPFHPRWIVGTDPDHVDGVERSPLSSLMGTTALTLAQQSHTLHHDDFLALSPEELSTNVDSIICNPPYTRHHALPSEYKQAINEQAEQETGLDISQASPLYAYVIYHAKQFLGAGERASFVIPHQFLATDYGKTLKQFLLSQFDVKAMLQFDPAGEGPFDGALTTCLILYLEVPDESGPSEYTRFIRLDDRPEDIPVRKLVQDDDQGPREWGFVNCVHQSDLDPADNWQSLFDPLDIDTAQLAPLSQLADVRRGVMTGENDFFAFTQAEVEDAGIATRYLSRVLPSPKIVQGYDFREQDWDHHRENEERVWLLYHVDGIDGVPETIDADTGCGRQSSKTLEKNASESIVEYLLRGLNEHPDLSKRHTVRTRSPWYRVDRRVPPPILVPYMSRSGFRAILNDADARCLNNYLGVYPDSNLSQTQLKALLAYLNSSFADEVVRRHDRTYAGGLDKLEPGDLGDVPVIDPREIAEESVRALAELFDSLRDAARGHGSTGDVLNRIDKILQRKL